MLAEYTPVLSTVLAMTSMITPVFVIFFAVKHVGVLRNIQYIDEHIYHAFFVILFVCMVQVLNSVYNLADRLALPGSNVFSITGISQDFMFMAILYCLGGCRNCRRNTRGSKK